MIPVYGIAEATLAVTIPAPAARPETIRLDKRRLECDGLCRPLDDADETPSVELMSVGRAISGLEVRIAGAKEPSGVGEVQVKGNSVISSYWNDEAATGQLKTLDGFLRTGDLGFIFGENLFIAGRAKDIIVIGGRNFLPQELERAAILATEPYMVGTTVAVGIYDERAGTECLHLLVEERKSMDSTTRLELETRMRSCLADRQGVTGIYVHWAGRGSIPYTSSGKVQRFLCREIIRGKLHVNLRPGADFCGRQFE